MIKHRVDTKIIFFLFTFVSTFSYQLNAQQNTKLAVVIVVDQFAYHFIQRLQKHFSGGLKHLLRNGINYTNAHQPHGVPSTSTGHTAFSTGTNAQAHGIIRNEWLNPMGELVICDQDSPENAAVFTPEGTLYQYGRSAKQILVDTISDQVVLDSSKNKVFAVSLKSRAAICCAGKLGKAIWLDKDTGTFTSSKAYFNELPEWVVSFNNNYMRQPQKLRKNFFFNQDTNTEQSTIPFNEMITWKPAYSYRPHLFYRIKRSQKLPTLFSTPQEKSDTTIYRQFSRTPHGNKAVLDVALECIKTQYDKENGKMLLWISLSSLDMLGHRVGPHDVKVIDMLYHLDTQLKSFFREIKHHIDSEQTVFFLTADHGVSPTPEYLHKKGIKSARRIIDETLINPMNQLLKIKYGIQNLLIKFLAPDFYFDLSQWDLIDLDTKKMIFNDLKNYLINQPGISHAWSAQELQQLCLQPGSIESFFQHQYHQLRSGQLIVQPEPYNFITSYHGGTTHWSPYNYDTHIPLVVYQKRKYHNKKINTKVWAPQVGNTIAHMLDVSQPSASTFEVLPGIRAAIVDTIEKEIKTTLSAQPRSMVKNDRPSCNRCSVR